MTEEEEDEEEDDEKFGNSLASKIPRVEKRRYILAHKTLL